jgi:hypothetical protein
MKKPSGLGTDFGNVITRLGLKKISFYDETYLKCKPFPSAFKILKKLHAKFDGKVFVISKCKKSHEKKILNWMKHHHFYKRTGIDKDHIYFCKKRSHKSLIGKRLQITHFIDDRLEVLSYMNGVKRLLFRPNKLEVKNFKRFLPQVTVVKSWNELSKLFEL